MLSVAVHDTNDAIQLLSNTRLIVTAFISNPSHRRHTEYHTSVVARVICVSLFLTDMRACCFRPMFSAPQTHLCPCALPSRHAFLQFYIYFSAFPCSSLVSALRHQRGFTWQQRRQARGMLETASSNRFTTGTLPYIQTQLLLQLPAYQVVTCV